MNRASAQNRPRPALIQRVGEFGRPYLPWKQGIAGSNPAALTNTQRTTTR